MENAIFRRFSESGILNTWRNFRNFLSGFIARVIDRMAGILVQHGRISGRIHHLARYGKNRRIRKKNCDRIFREFMKVR
ncbi:MAG: hypothetical protein E7496_07405 [Ruminococcus sp.]|nr:hypothetical protein [Ruminococcus sp.]